MSTKAGELQSVAGLALGTLFFAASLTPSLVPRNALTQGALAGGCFAIGYGLGVFLRWLWRYLELPELAPRTRSIVTSLGALNSARSFDLFDIIGDPIAGAVWSGPPFASRVWRSITDGRNDGSPMWLPEFRDSRFVRFMNQNGSTVPPEAPWGPMRLVFLQYASDAITFFDPRDAFRRPAWMDAPVGPDVSPKLSWYPIVTMLKLAVDMPMAMQAPPGYGHVFAPEHYVDAWVAAADVRTWTPESLAKLKRFLGEEARRAMKDGDSAYAGRGG